MPSVMGFIDAVNEEALRKAVKELHDFQKSGILCDGVVRSLTSRLATSTNIPHRDASHIVQKYLVERAAYLWAGISEDAIDKP